MLCFYALQNAVHKGTALQYAIKLISYDLI